MRLRLILALFWMAIGILVLAFDVPMLRLPLGGTEISTGWIAFLFALYHLAWWWGGRGALAAQRAAQESARLREQTLRKSKSPEEERNPDFMFDDPSLEERNPPPG